MNQIRNLKLNKLVAIFGAAAIALLLKALSNESKQPNQTSKKRIFISFAIEDEIYRDYLVKQARDEKSPFTFVDMSVKKPWPQEVWKQKCRSKIKSCDGVIILLSKKTWHSSGARWETKCAKEEGIPVIGMHVKKNERGSIPPELKGKKIISWSWENLANVINKI